MIEDDPLIVTMRCQDCAIDVPVTVHGAQTALRNGANADQPFRARMSAECPKCGGDLSRVVTLWAADDGELVLSIAPAPPTI